LYLQPAGVGPRIPSRRPLTTFTSFTGFHNEIGVLVLGWTYAYTEVCKKTMPAVRPFPSDSRPRFREDKSLGMVEIFYTCPLAVMASLTANTWENVCALGRISMEAVPVWYKCE
jgi:hypothetical protein